MGKCKAFFINIGGKIKSFFVFLLSLTVKGFLSVIDFFKSLPNRIKTAPSRFNKWRKTDEGKKALFEILRTIIAIAIALIVAVIIIAIASKNPLESIGVFLTSPFASSYTFSKMFTEAVPLIFTGVSVCIMVRCGQFNMIGEGSFFAGGLIGAVVAANFNLPPIILPIVALAISAVVTGAVGYIPAKLKAGLKVNELVTSLMLNFIIFWICMYFFTYHFADPDYSSIATPIIPDKGKLPFLSEDNELSSSLIIALVTALAAYIFLAKTRFGYAIRMCGDNPRFTSYSGIKTSNAIVYSQVIGSGVAGLGGAAFIMGNFYRFSWTALPNYGFDGFIVAIMARNKPLVVPVIALLFGYMRTGAMEMARLTDVPNEIIFIVQAVMIILIGGQAFYEFMRKKSAKKAASKKDKGSGIPPEIVAETKVISSAQIVINQADKEGQNA